MKNWKLICMLAVIFFTLSSGKNLVKQVEKIETVVIRIQEAFKGSAAGLGRESEMIVIRPDGSTKIVLLEDLSKKYSVEGAQNGALIKKEIDKWLNKKFEIVSVSSDGDINIQRT